MLIVTSKEALAVLDGLLDPRSLTQIQLYVFDRTWAGDSYAAIAQGAGYDEDYIKSVGARLWRTISQLLDLRVSKNNLKSAFGEYARKIGERDDRIGLNLRSEIGDLERFDWGDAPDLDCFYGRKSELDCLTEWISIDKCKLVTLLGMGGIGKTTTLAQVVSQLADTQEFEYIIWRSLRNAPPLERLLADLISFLSNRLETTVEINILIQQLRTSRCLIILDNWETILDPDRMGELRAGSEGYSHLLEAIATTAHQSCVAITSRERPAVLMPLEGDKSPVQILRLQGSSEVASGILADRELIGTTADLAELGDRYSNNPLAIKIVATTICDLFDRHVRAFLDEETLAFGGIERLLDRQFGRLSELETSVMYWLAINRDGTTIATLDRELVPSVAKGKILAALESLCGRSLIDRDRGRFTQQPVVMEYVTDRLIEAAIAEICQQAPQTLFTHALIEARAPEYIRESQSKLILTPLLARLESKLGDRATLIQLFRQNLARLQPQHRQGAIDPTDLHPLGYGAGNLLNFLCHLQADLTGADLSGLIIRQAYLRDTALQQANFTNVNAIECAFAEAMSDMFGLAFSPDGTLVAMVSIAGTLSVYRITTGEWLYAIAAHASVTMGVVFDRAGTSIYTGSFDRQICQWDVATGNCVRSWPTDSSMWDIALSPDDRYLASGHENNTVYIWDLQTLECVRTLSAHAAMVTCIDFHPQLPLLASSSADGTFKLWDYRTGECLKTATEHTNMVWDVKFHPHGTGIASVSDGLAKLWNLELECLHTFEVGIVSGRPLAFSTDGRVFGCSSTDTKIRLWDVESGKLLRVLPSGRNLWNIIFSPDGETLVSSSDGAQVKFWDVNLGQCTKTLQGEAINFWSIAIDPHGTLIASGGDDMRVRLWDVAEGKCVQTLAGHTSRITNVLFHPQQPLLVSCCYDGTIKLWDLRGRCLQTFVQQEGGRIQAIAFHPTQPLLVGSGYDATTRFLNIETGRSIRTLGLPDDNTFAHAIAFNPDGNLLATGDEKGFLMLWDVESGELIRQLSAHQMRLWTLDFHPDGHLLASGGHDGTVKIWDTATGECARAIEGLNGKVMSVKFSSDGTLLAISCESIVQIWELATQTCLRTLTGHTKLIYATTFDPARPEILFSAGDDGTIREWNITTGECLQVLRPDRLYEGMNITDAIGLSEGQRATLKALGAVEE